jgi:hypothetical protein
MGATDKYASPLRETKWRKSRASIKYPNDLRLPFNAVNMLVRRRPRQTAALPFFVLLPVCYREKPGNQTVVFIG